MEKAEVVMSRNKLTEEERRIRKEKRRIKKEEATARRKAIGAENLAKSLSDLNLTKDSLGDPGNMRLIR
ncbi:MAG: hypothetical protein WC682_02715 [Parcubacteria group bacterium]|jgi:hypothetical protein